MAEFFGGSSLETQVIKGLWQQGGVVYSDELLRIVVDFPESVKNRRWMRDFKARWKERTEQLEIWMVSWRIEVE